MTKIIPIRSDHVVNSTVRPEPVEGRPWQYTAPSNRSGVRQKSRYPEFLSVKLFIVLARVGILLAVAVFALNDSEAQASAPGFFFGSLSGTATATTAGAGTVTDTTPDVIGFETLLIAVNENPFAV